MLVHAQQGEQRIVEFGYSAAWPMVESLARLKLVVIAPVAH
jgi:hypothetical protein